MKRILAALAVAVVAAGGGAAAGYWFLNGNATQAAQSAQPGATAKVRQNLALVVGLAGRFAEAEQIASAELPADQAAANIQILRQMLEQQKQQPPAAKKPRATARIPQPSPGT